jgi:hypothetical protein
MSLCERRYMIISDLRRYVFRKARNFLILEKKTKIMEILARRKESARGHEGMQGIEFIK